jgi:hypothetical protein
VALVERQLAHTALLRGFHAKTLTSRYSERPHTPVRISNQRNLVRGAIDFAESSQNPSPKP